MRVWRVTGNDMLWMWIDAGRRGIRDGAGGRRAGVGRCRRGLTLCSSSF